MRKLLCLAVIMTICLTACAQSQTRVPEQQNTELDTTAVLLLERISQHTAPCYKLYKTENMWTFLELETFTGRIWQVQYTVNDSHDRMKTSLNVSDLTVDDGNAYAGRFELYPTQNIYNFILLDTYTGRTWQTQWSTNYSDRGIIEIK